MKKLTLFLLVITSVLLVNVVFAEEENTAKDFAPFLGEWKGERENNMGWQILTERFRVVGYRSVAMKVFVKDDRGYVKYEEGPFEGSPPVKPKKREAKVRYEDGEPRLCFEAGRYEMEFRLDKGMLKGRFISARINHICHLSRKQ